MAIQDQSIERQLAQFQRDRLVADGAVTSYYDVGDGVDVVLLHGIGSSGASWVNVFEQQPGPARLIAWDAPGYGASTPLGEPTPTAADYAKALNVFIDGLALENPHLVGHSLGAIMAMSFAAAHPDKISKLLLLDPARGYGGESEDTREEKLSSRLCALHSLGPVGLAKQQADRLLSSHSSEEERALVRWNMSRVTPGGYEQASRMLAHADILDDARQYAGPTLVACGEEDIITPPSLAKTIANATPNATYRNIPLAGHASYVERPEMFIELLTEWIEV